MICVGVTAKGRVWRRLKKYVTTEDFNPAVSRREVVCRGEVVSRRDQLVKRVSSTSRCLSASPWGRFVRLSGDVCKPEDMVSISAVSLFLPLFLSLSLSLSPSLSRSLSHTHFHTHKRTHSQPLSYFVNNKRDYIFRNKSCCHFDATEIPLEFLFIYRFTDLFIDFYFYLFIYFCCQNCVKLILCKLSKFDVCWSIIISSIGFNSLFFSNSKILSPSLPGMTLFTSLVSFPIWSFYCDICDCHIRPARAWTPTLNVWT